MTRLRTASSTTTTTEDESVTSSTTGNWSNKPRLDDELETANTQQQQQQGPANIRSAIESDSSTELETTDSDENNENNNNHNQALDSEEAVDDGCHSSAVGYNNYELLETEDDDCSETGHERQYRNARDWPLLEEAVHEFGVTSAKRFSIGHDQDYDLRPNFAILKHKTEDCNSSSSDNCNRAARETLSSRRGNNQDNPNKIFPKTPDWFFNIPDTRSPFPTFGSKVTDDID